MVQAALAESTPQIVGLLPEGVSDEVARDVGRRISDMVHTMGRGATVRSLRFVPSSLSKLGDDRVQFVANATVEPVAGRAGTQGRAKVVDSVITMEGGIVREVKVPFLEIAV